MRMATGGEKRCAVCGTDVSQSKRTRGGVGNYYCPTCVPAAPPYAVPTAPSPEAPKACANCGTGFGALERGIEWRGQRVCARCHEVLQAEERSHRQDEAVAAERAAAQERANASKVAAETKRTRLLEEARRKCATLSKAEKVSAVGTFICVAMIVCRVGEGTDEPVVFTKWVFGVFFILLYGACRMRKGDYAKYVADADAAAAVVFNGTSAAPFPYTPGTGLRPPLPRADWLVRTFGRKCPKCKVRGHVKSSSRQVGSRTVQRRETRIATHTDANHAKVTGTTRYEVDVAHEVPVYRTKCYCQSCGHEWKY